LLALAACGASPAPVAPAPVAPQLVMVRRSPLDAAAFLEGCWKLDQAVFDLETCWHREPRAWVGRVSAKLGRAADEHDFELQIIAVGRDLFLEVFNPPDDDWFRHQASPLFTIGMDHLAFGFSDEQLELALTVDREQRTLHIASPRYAYDLKRTTLPGH
jgi:hypothetical protein